MRNLIVRTNRLVWGSPGPAFVGKVFIEDLPVLLRQDAEQRTLPQDRLRVYLVEVFSVDGPEVMLIEQRVLFGDFAEVDRLSRELANI